MFGIENLIVWREANAFAASVETACASMRGLTSRSAASQLIRAADSIGSNIAEGYGKGVSQDGLRYFRTAKSSADEVENHLRRARASGRLAADVVDKLLGHLFRVRFLILRYA